MKNFYASQFSTWLKSTTLMSGCVGLLMVSSVMNVGKVWAQEYEPYSCDADLNEDSVVDTKDYSILIKDFFKDNPENWLSDINTDDIVDVSDYAAMVVVFGQKCDDNDWGDFDEGDGLEFPSDVSGGVSIIPGTDGPTVRPTPTPLPSGVPTPIPSPTPQPSPIDPLSNPEPNSKLQTLIDQYPAGTTFILRAGVYRTRTLRLKPGSVIQGEPGAILSGARVLNPAQAKAEGSFYYFANQLLTSTPYPAGFRGVVGTSESVSGYACQTTAPMCNFNEELFINDRKLKRVQSKTQLAVGTWFYDSANSRVYMGENPAGKLVELSVVPTLIQDTPELNGGGKVTLKNFVIEKFAAPAQSFAIELSGPENVVEFNEIRYNHGGGVSVGAGSKIRHNYIHHNGQLGIGGAAAHDALIERNLITRNSTGEFDPTWVSGGLWMTGSDRLKIQDNWVRHNQGAGIAVEEDSLAASVLRNQLVENGTNGVQIGLSFDCVVQNNYLKGNGISATEFYQIAIRNSSGCKVLNNIVSTNENNTLLNGGINLHTGENRGNSLRFSNRAYNTSNTQVMDNQLYFPVNPGYALRVFSRATQAPSNFASIARTISIDRNKYWMKNTGGTRWIWGANEPITFAAFQSFGRDLAGSVSEFTAVPPKPDWRWAVGQQPLK